VYLPFGPEVRAICSGSLDAIQLMEASTLLLYHCTESRDADCRCGSSPALGALQLAAEHERVIKAAATRWNVFAQIDSTSCSSVRGLRGLYGQIGCY
jgi:hypothetical protein